MRLTDYTYKNKETCRITISRFGITHLTAPLSPKGIIQTVEPVFRLEKIEFNLGKQNIAAALYFQKSEITKYLMAKLLSNKYN